MYAFVPAIVLLGVGIWLYRHEVKKEPHMRNNATIMIATYAFILGIGLVIVSIINWGNI